MKKKINSFDRRKARVRAKLRKISDKYRLSVFKSGKHIYAQIIDDSASVTLAAASTLDVNIRKIGKSNSNIDSAVKVGKLLANLAEERNIKSVAFDKGGHRYHGAVKALADAVREKVCF